MESSASLSASELTHIGSDQKLSYLGIALALAAALRAWMASADLPDYFHIDEGILLDEVGTIRWGHLNPEFFFWPGSLQFYVIAILFWLFYMFGRVSGRFTSPSEFNKFFWTEPGSFCALARCLNVACGVITVFLVSKVVRPLGTMAMTIAAGLVLFSPTHVRESAQALTDVPTAMMMMVAIGFFSRMVQRTFRRDYFVCGLLIGLATANKYYAAFTFAGIFTAALTVPAVPLARRLKMVALAVVGGLVGFLAGCPFCLLDYPTFLSDVHNQLLHQQRGHVGFDAEGTRIFWFVTRLLVPAVGWPALVLAAIGCWLAFFSSLGRAYRPVAVVLLLCFLVLGNSSVSFDRYVIPLVPLVAVMCALPVSWLAQRWRASAILVTIITLAFPATVTMEMCYTRCKVDTRYAAAAILTANGIRGRKVLTTSSGPRVPGAEIINFWDKPAAATISAVKRGEYDYVVMPSIDFHYTLASITRQRHPEVYLGFDEIKRSIQSRYEAIYLIKPDATLKGSAITVYRARGGGGAMDQPSLKHE